MPITIRVDADVKRLSRQLDELRIKQLPFATSSGLTSVAKLVQQAEQAALPSIFDRPTPFTLKSIGVQGATKANPTAAVFVKDIAAAYLAPFETGGTHFLGGKRGLLAPKAQPVNQYGNLPRAALARLKGRQNVFVGSIKTKSGDTIRGVFERTGQTRRGTARKGTKAKPVRHGLKLLIRFTDPLPVKPTFHYRERAQRIVEQRLAGELAKALNDAMRTARP